MNDIKYMSIALKEAYNSLKTNDIPIGAVIVLNDKIIAKAHNTKDSKNISTHHAELLAIEKACKKLKTWHLDNCILYTTCEPCMMCMGAIIQSRIKTIVYSTKNDNFGVLESKNTIFDESKYIVRSGILEEEATILLKDFFKNKR